jgi:hypothetical protein
VDDRTVTYWQEKLGIDCPDGRKNAPRLDDSVFFRSDFWWLIGYLQGDGHVGSKKILCTSVDSELIESAVSLFEELFGLQSRIRTYFDGNPKHRLRIQLEAFSCELSDWLMKQGFQFGIMKWNVPVLPTNLFCSYLAGLFDAEGCVHISKNKMIGPRIRVIELTSKNRNCLEMITGKLAEFGVKSRISMNSRFISRFEIYGRGHLKWFIDNIGPFSRLPRKRNLLNRGYLPLTSEEMNHFLSNALAETKVKVSPAIEKEIWELSGNGLPSSTIARMFGITKTTVRRHLTQPFYR